MSRLARTPVGAAEIAHALGVKPDTVYQWQQRHLLPPASWRVSGRPAWPWSVIEHWAAQTGRRVVNPPEICR